jgi:hypothetical protein
MGYKTVTLVSFLCEMHGTVKVCSFILNHDALLTDTATTANLSHILSTGHETRNDLRLQHNESGTGGNGGSADGKLSR